MHVYLLEDNLNEAAFFKDCLVARQHDVTHFDHPAAFFGALTRQRPSLVVLDWMLPEMDGLTALKRVRERFGSQLPVVMLSCMNDQTGIVAALECGADDYLLKPMTRAELVARIEALMRRVAPVNNTVPAIECGPYILDYRTQSATINGQSVSMTPKEFDVAWVLFSERDVFIPKTNLVTSVWGKRADIATHTVTQHVHVVRKKLQLAAHGFRLSAVYGSGYRLECPAETLEPPGGRMASKMDQAPHGAPATSDQAEPVAASSMN